ncbi:uncharacterized protein [Oscarella lobularis]|uniref:uncharacterized protein isoform X2 n=1 Tax=Oscarella lobularis TaxID=121494 RepID=UPI0033144A7B
MRAIGFLAFAFLTAGLTAHKSKECIDPGSVISANIQVKVCESENEKNCIKQTKGPPGKAGPAGPRGDMGPQGEEGQKGDMGPQGEEGQKGDMGPQGEEGQKGDMGERGPRGHRGEKGMPGNGTRETMEYCQMGTVRSAYCNSPAHHNQCWPEMNNITFTPCYRCPPVISVGLVRVDSASHVNMRVYANPESVTRFGFTLKMAAWSDSFVYTLEYSWTACPTACPQS